MSRLRSRTSSLTRSGRHRRAPKPQIIIVCEGKVTEPSYFKDFSVKVGNPLVEVSTIGGCGVPESVVSRAIEERRQKELEARKSGDSFDTCQVWAVFDRDSHPGNQVQNAFARAKEHGIHIAFSNPCFEVWALMHFEQWARPGHHHDAQAALKSRLRGYCHDKHPVFDIEILFGRYVQAVENSKRALIARSEEGSPFGDPSTTVFELTERITTYGRSYWEDRIRTTGN